LFAIRSTWPGHLNINNHLRILHSEKFTGGYCENIINSIKNKDDTDLPTAVKKRMMAVHSFINTLQNEFGPISIGQPDYLKASREQFDNFVMMYSTDNPIYYDGELAMRM